MRKGRGDILSLAFLATLMLLYIMDIDYTFNNPLIRSYFDGDDSYVPVGELIYLHSHPMVRPNFITEIDEIVLRAGQIMVDLKLTHYSDKLIEEGILIGKALKGDNFEIDYASGQVMLEAMRRVFNMCKDIIDKLQ